MASRFESGCEYQIRKTRRMRRGKPHSVEEYVRVRLEFLYEEKKKNNDVTAHMILDKSIFELSIILEMLTRNT